MLRSWIAKGRNVFVDGPEGSGRRALALEATRRAERLFVDVRTRSLRNASELLDVPAIVHGLAEPTTVTLRAVLGSASQLAPVVYLDALHHVPESVRLDVLTLVDTGAPLPDPRTEAGMALPEAVAFCVPINNARPPLGSLPVVPDPFASFVIVKVDYPDVEDEIEACRARTPALDEAHLAHIVDAANALRHDPLLERDLPHSTVLEACELLAESQGSRSLEDVLRGVFCARFTGRYEDDDSEARAAWEIIASTLPG